MKVQTLNKPTVQCLHGKISLPPVITQTNHAYCRLGAIIQVQQPCVFCLTQFVLQYFDANTNLCHKSPKSLGSYHIAFREQQQFMLDTSVVFNPLCWEAVL